MTRSPFRRVLPTMFVAVLLPVLAACPKKPQPTVADAEPPPVVVDAAPTVLEPIVEDSGVDAAEAGKPHAGGGKPTDPLVSRLKQCCTALTNQAKSQGNPPEMLPVVNTCNATAAQLSANPNAPELNALRPLLKMVKNLPALCAGL